MYEDNYIDALSLAETYQLTEPNVEYLALKLYSKELMKKFDLKIKPGIHSRIC
jgi:predicted metal-binding protein